MQKIHIIQDFDVPREKVFSFFSQHERLSEIYPGAFKRIVNSNDPSNINGLGSVRRITNFPIVLDEKVTRFSDPGLIEYKLIEGAPMIRNHIGIMHFYELDNGARSRLDYTIEFEGKLPMSGFILKNLMESTIGGGVRDLSKRFSQDPNY
ncbi:MAG: SRPBCC family protein [Bacteroidetes bacterium]|nr:SRPBCC family protein [Bacteroidota bacterium]